MRPPPCCKVQPSIWLSVDACARFRCACGDSTKGIDIRSDGLSPRESSIGRPSFVVNGAAQAHDAALTTAAAEING